MITSKIRFLFVALLLLGISHTSLYGQQRLGVAWNIPGDMDSAQTQLQQFHELGISVLETDRPPSSEVWNIIDSLEFVVYGNLDINFPITQTFSEPDSNLVKHIENSVSNYLSHASVKAIGLFNYGNIREPKFWEAVSPFADRINQVQNLAVYYKTDAPPEIDISSFSFPIINVSVTPKNYNSLAISLEETNRNYQYNPSAELRSLLKPFKNFISSVGPSENSTIFMRSGWVLMMIKNHPEFSAILQSLSSDSKPIFPLPNEKIPAPDTTSLPMILLLLIWGTVALHYNTSPLYRKSLFRYFTAHKFFIDDIFKRLIRSPLPALIIIMQNTLLISTSVYVLFISFISPMGHQAFFHHFTGLDIAGGHPFSIFIWTFIIVLALCLISMIWLYFSHEKIRSFTQIATLYAWPLQLNFLFCTAVITFFSTSGAMYITLFTAISLLLLLLSYIFTALDISRFARFKGKHLFKTVVPYTVIIAGLFVWLFTNNQWLEALTLALNLT